VPNLVDSELVARSLRGDERAFRELISRHHGVAYAVVRSILGDRDEVDDVMQVVYLKAYQGLGSFRGEARFSTWLYQIARREAIDVIGRRRRETLDIDDVAVFDAIAEGAGGDEDRVSKDQPAADYIMGHESTHMSSVYREGISDARLKAVTDHVRKWLFATGD